MEQQPLNGGKLDAANPYFLHHSDHPGMVLVSKPLNGDNYSTWCRAMTISLNAKSKLGFIDGTTTMPSATDKPDEHASWKKCNDMILSWILNSLSRDLATVNAPRIFQIERDIACLTQDQMTVAAYYTRLKKLWDELGSYNDTVCSCGADHKRRRLMQFLMGLNESYNAIRGQILLMNPLPDRRSNEAWGLHVRRQRTQPWLFEGLNRWHWLFDMDKVLLLVLTHLIENLCIALIVTVTIMYEKHAGS
ncbi:hypothetical protein AAG906_011936 [Vitis piasezkii]